MDRCARARAARAGSRRRRRDGRTRRPPSPESPASRSRDDVLGAAQVGERLRERLRHVGLGVAEGREQQHAGVSGGARQVPQEEQRRRVGPVPVLEHEQHRPAPADAGEQVGNRRVEAEALGVGIGLDRRGQLADPGRQIGQQPGQLAAAGAERGAQLGGIGDPRRGWSSASTNGPVGRPHDGVAGAVEDQRAIRAPPRAANSRTSRLLPSPGSPPSSTTRRPSPSARGIRRARALELGRAPDERKGRGEPERAREVRDLGVHATTIVRSDHSRRNRPQHRRSKWVRSGHDRRHSAVLGSTPIRRSRPSKEDSVSTTTSPARSARRSSPASRDG